MFYKIKNYQDIYNIFKYILKIIFMYKVSFLIIIYFYILIFLNSCKKIK